MATQYWVGDGGTNLWNSVGCWANVSGGAGGSGIVPVAGDNVVFDALSVRNCTMDVASAGLNTLDFSGYVRTFNQAGFNIVITGPTFKLVAGMTFVHGNGGSLMAATAGTTQITSGGQQLGALRLGTAGPGGTYQLQDSLNLGLYIDLNAGVFNTNNQAVSLNGSLNVNVGAGANSLVAGSSQIIIGQNLNQVTTAAWLSAGTSKFTFFGNGTITLPFGAAAVVFYDLEVANGITNFNWANSNTITILHRMTTGAGILNKADGARANRIDFLAGTSGIADQFHPDPGLTVTMEGIDFRFETGGGAVPVVVELWPCNFTLTQVLATSGALRFSSGALTQNVVVRPVASCVYNCAGGFLFSDAGGVDDAGSPGAMSKVLDLNGFNLSFLGGGITNGRDAANGRAWRFIIGAGLTFATAGYLEYYPNAAANAAHDIAGTWNLGGNFTYTGTASPVRTLNFAATGLLAITGSVTVSSAMIATLPTGAIWRVGGNWASNGSGMSFSSPNTGEVNFIKAGAFTIATDPNMLWPVLSITNGGVVTLPVGLNVYDLVATNATITINAPVTVRHVYIAGGTATITATVAVGSGFATLPGAVVNYGTGGNIEPTGAGFTLDLQAVLPFFSIGPEVARVQILRTCTVTSLVIEDRFTPLVLQLLAGGTFTVPLLTNNISWPEAVVQVISSTPTVQASWNVAAFSSTFNLWPRDILFSGAVITGGLSNRNLGNNTGGTFNSDGQLRGITDDPGWDDLAGVEVGSMQYCWLVSTTLVGLTALAVAFGAGARNWHRRTRLPFAVLDNLKIGTGYFISYGLRDDRDRRIAPTIAAGGFFEGYAFAGSGGGGLPQKIAAHSKYVF